MLKDTKKKNDNPLLDLPDVTKGGRLTLTQLGVVIVAIILRCFVMRGHHTQ